MNLRSARKFVLSKTERMKVMPPLFATLRENQKVAEQWRIPIWNVNCAADLKEASAPGRHLCPVKLPISKIAPPIPEFSTCKNLSSCFSVLFNSM
jgi:hypothetical protein